VQAVLQIAQVVLAQSEVIEEVSNAALRFRAGPGDGFFKFLFHGEAGFTKFLEFSEKAGHLR